MLVCDLVCISIDRAENLTFLLVSRKSLHEERHHGGCWIILGCWTWKTKKSTWRTSCDRCGDGTTRLSLRSTTHSFATPLPPCIELLLSIIIYRIFTVPSYAYQWLAVGWPGCQKHTICDYDDAHLPHCNVYRYWTHGVGIDFYLIMHVFPLFLLIHHGQLYPPSQPRLRFQPRSSLHKNCQRPAVLTLLGFVPCFIAAFLGTQVGEVVI